MATATDGAGFVVDEVVAAVDVVDGGTVVVETGLVVLVVVVASLPQALASSPSDTAPAVKTVDLFRLFVISIHTLRRRQLLAPSQNLLPLNAMRPKKWLESNLSHSSRSRISEPNEVIGQLYCRSSQGNRGERHSYPWPHGLVADRSLTNKNPAQLSIDQTTVFKVDGGQRVLFNPIVLRVLPFGLITTLWQEMHAAHEIVGIEILWVHPGKKWHIVILRPQRWGHRDIPVVVHVVQQATNQVADEVGTKCPARSKVAKYPQ